jgi:hypothetical protein
MISPTVKRWYTVQSSVFWLPSELSRKKNCVGGKVNNLCITMFTLKNAENKFTKTVAELRGK